MKLNKVLIHNFRSLKDVEFSTNDYSILVGENNCGKSNILCALRAFYEVDGFKFKKDIDFPKFNTDDHESFVELHFLTTNEEQEDLRIEYQSPDKILRVRRYFSSDNKELIQTDQSNIYGYEGGKLSQNLFYGAKNVSQAKLGDIIFIPAVSKTDDTLKLSGPSPLRDMLNFVMKRAVADSSSYLSLATAFETFNNAFREEASKDGFSVKELVGDINKEIESWRVKFNIDINAIKPEEIVKGLLTHWIEDERLDNSRLNVASFGQGLQRHLIYTLIRLSSKYQARPSLKKKEFRPDFLLILFEEPEAFLHPTQQDNLRLSLKNLSQQNETQVICTTHSAHFVSKNSEELTGIVKLNRPEHDTKCFQLSEVDLKKLNTENSELYKRFCELLDSPKTSEELKREIRNKHLGDEIPDIVKKSSEESFKFFLYLDSERSSMFFANHILLCEGASEKKFIDLIIDNHLPGLRAKQIYVLDAMGKFNLHRFMTLLGKLGITHSIIYDEDGNRSYHEVINEFLNEKKNDYTVKMYSFKNDLETFLGIDKPQRSDLKPLNVIMQYTEGKISSEKITALKDILENLC
ncbi:MAG: ATP-dependent endonuclease [Candidatus Brocadia sp. WS118]|nr:MAG: ATP-dependent endonuclease [Candidatus Brocadia sp. WS118]